MPGRTATLAKLTPPRLYAVTRRERLFTLVDERCRHHSLVWIAGPPGAGKTSLIASYLAESKQRTLWYHVDPGDADLATFFHYLVQAAQGAAGKKRLRLSALTPEFMADVPGFTRRFMRELWDKVPLPATLVLDDYQDLPAEATVHSVLPLALAEFPLGATLAVISRSEPPPSFAREQAHNMIGHIGWEHLRLTLEETRALASSIPDIEPSTVASLHAATNGWMAGTKLMLERLRTSETWTQPSTSGTMPEIFHYFATQVFAHMDLGTRKALMRTGFLPWMTETMADEVSEYPGTGQMVRTLYQRGLFVDRRADGHVRYQYHDLFREFLVDQCREHFDQENLHRLKHRAAHVAETYGQDDTLVTLYAETKSWDDLSRIICERAEALLSQGRNQTLQGYIARLPREEQQHHPWLLYWSGMSRLVFDPITAQKDLEEAFTQFEVRKDSAGMLLSGSAIIEAYNCGVGDMAPTGVWGTRLQQLLSQNNGFPSLAIEARVLTHLQGLIYASPHHPLLAELEESLDRILSSLEDPASRFGVTATFVNLPLWRGDFRRMRQLLDRLTPYMDSALIPPVTRLHWNVMEANYAWNVRNHAQTKEKLAQVELGVGSCIVHS